MVVSLHLTVAVVARPLGSGASEDAAYEFGVTVERDLVAACARSLAARLAPLA